MKNIKIDLSVYLLGILYLIGGYYKRTLILIGVLFTHEIGHLTMMKMLHYKVESIHIYPFGGIIKMHKLLNAPIKHDMAIAAGGILMQCFLEFVLFGFYKIHWINPYTWETCNEVNLTLIGINLIPIYPLDGYEISKALLNRFFPFIPSQKIAQAISLLFILVGMYRLPKRANLILIGIFLWIKRLQYKKEYPWILQKFLLERKEYNLPYKRIEYSKEYNQNLLKKETYHYFGYKSEKKCIEAEFDKYNCL